jgi:hypothetical protein
MKEYEFDFLTAMGDLIKEKYESFYDLLDKINKNSKIYSVVGSHETVSIFEVGNVGLTPSPIIAQICEITYIGCFKSRFRQNSLNFDFGLYEIERMAKNELILICEKETVVVKLLNFPF